MAEQRIVYDDFSRGEYGHLGGRNAPAGSFTGRNIIRYRNGMVGPRPGIKASLVSPAAGTALNNIWWAQGAPNTDIWWVDSTGAVKKSRFDTGVITAVGNIVAPAAGKVAQAVDAGLGINYLTVQGDKCYTINLPAPSVTAHVGSVGGIDIAIKGDRLFVTNNGTAFFTVYYSNAAAFATWTATDFFTVGAKAGVAGLVHQRDHLAILLQDGSWWAYRGIGSTASLRKITPGGWYPWVLNPHAKALMTDDRIAYMGPIGDWPIKFDGANIEHFPQAGPSGDVQPYSSVTGVRVLPVRRAGECAIILPDAVNGARVYLGRENDAWSIHTLPTGISELAASSGQGVIALTNKTTPSIYLWDLRIDRPAFTSDTYARPGDLSDTPVDAYFYLPEHWSTPGTEVRVRQVIVDFVKYQTGATGDDCGFNLDLKSFGQFENDGTESPTSQAWSEDGSAASTAGVRDRHVFNVGEQGFGAGFQVGFTGVKGVAIAGVTVVVDTQASRPRG
jgi:hypothetical protein